MESFEYTGNSNLEAMKEAKKYNAFLESLITKQVKKTDKILDIGAGIGLFAESLSKKGFNISCVEPDTYQADVLKEKGLQVNTSVDEIEDESLDFIYALNVLEHIENDQDELISWSRKLKKGGKMLIYVPAFNVLFSSMDRKVGHFRRYRRKELDSKMESAHLKPISKARYADSLGFWVSLLYKMIDKGDGDINKKSLIIYDTILFPISRVGDVFFSNLFGKNVFIVAERAE